MDAIFFLWLIIVAVLWARNRSRFPPPRPSAPTANGVEKVRAPFFCPHCSELVQTDFCFKCGRIF